MTEFTVRLENAEGLHARPAAVMVKLASQFQSKIEIKAKGQVKNAKSLMSLLSLGLEKGDEIQIIAQGEDGAAAASALQKLIQNQFAE
ncbi:MAG: HPr family phosphocarrier protein [Bdellovibrionaceae bacterium]|nr:HPr family phosphocarrier protein [Pseudobdellovibrionaceae bacterium]MBX3034259.1 HPr family phosphocarrier protein [Pseudobdellovibrionaceae bacterium]